MRLSWVATRRDYCWVMGLCTLDYVGKGEGVEMGKIGVVCCVL